MTTLPATFRSSTRALAPELVDTLRKLQPGQRMQITQTVRVGFQEWTTTVPGTFRAVNYLATGLATDRIPEDDIVVVTVHFTKDNGEHSSVSLDEHTRLELL